MAELSVISAVLEGVISTFSSTSGVEVTVIRKAVGADVAGMAGTGLLVGGLFWEGRGIAVFVGCFVGVGDGEVGVTGIKVGFRVLVGFLSSGCDIFVGIALDPHISL